MKSRIAISSMTILCIGYLLSGCAISEAAENIGLPDIQTGNAATIQQNAAPIDWERANADAAANDTATTSNDVKLQRSSTNQMVVPLMLPPDSITLSDALPAAQTLAPAQLITDQRGYSAVIQAETFTILIDASNQTFVTDEQNGVTAQTNFDSEYQQIENGGQITIGRYGALYAVQLLCLQDAQTSCISERMVREVIESLAVVQPKP